MYIAIYLTKLTRLYVTSYHAIILYYLMLIIFSIYRYLCFFIKYKSIKCNCSLLLCSLKCNVLRQKNDSTFEFYKYQKNKILTFQWNYKQNLSIHLLQTIKRL